MIAAALKLPGQIPQPGDVITFRRSDDRRRIEASDRTGSPASGTAFRRSDDRRRIEASPSPVWPAPAGWHFGDQMIAAALKRDQSIDLRGTRQRFRRSDDRRRIE